MDILGEVLQSLRVLTNSIGIFDFGAPWGFSMPALSPNFACSLTVIEGPLWFESAASAPVLLEPGDTVLVLNGTEHRYMSAPDAPALPLIELLKSEGAGEFGPQTRRDGPVKIEWGDGTQRTRLLTLAFLLHEPAHSPLLGTLPRIILLRRSARSLFPWVPATLDFLAAEATSAMPGYTATAARLAELIFTSFLRAHVVSAPESGTGWVRGIADVRIGKALACIHTRPEEPWTAALLARQAGMARSTFARRFTELLGQPPIDYLIAFRLQVACDRLLTRRISVAAAAESCGYQSERAFRQAFKARYGLAPKRYAQAVRTLK